MAFVSDTLSPLISTSVQRASVMRSPATLAALALSGAAL